MVKRSLALLALACALVPTSAQASPPDTFGYGARAHALGGAVVADVDGVSANYYNPAGIVAGKGVHLAVSYLSLSNRLELNERRTETGRTGATQIGLTAPVQIGNVRLALGVAFHLDDNLLSRVRSVERDRPRWDLYDDRAHKLFLGLNLAVQPVRWLRIGVGMAMQSTSEIDLNLNGRLSALNGERDARLTHNAGGTLASVRAWNAGVQFVPNDRISFGLTYRGGMKLFSVINAAVATNVDALIADVPLDITIFTRSTTMYIPQQVAFGTALRPIPRLRLSFDLTWADWTKHPGAGATENVTIALDAPPGFPINVPGNIPARQPIPLNLRDTWSPRFGVEGTVLSNSNLDLYVRGGYVYQPTAYPAQTGASNLIDADRHVATLGIGAWLRNLRPAVPGTLRIDAYALFAYLPDRWHIKSSPVDPVGDYLTGGTQIATGVTMELAFE